MLPSYFFIMAFISVALIVRVSRDEKQEKATDLTRAILVVMWALIMSVGVVGVLLTSLNK